MKKPRFDIYESRDGWRWRLIAANGRILASGEAHTRKADAERAVATVKRTVSRMVNKAILDKARPPETDLRLAAVWHAHDRKKWVHGPGPS